MTEVRVETTGASDGKQGKPGDNGRLQPSPPPHANSKRMRPGPLQQPLALDASFQNYAWGDRRFIPDLFRFSATGAPFAEAWFGAHPLLPSTLHLDGAPEPLDRALESRAVELLGPAVAQDFGGLPFLL